jgi:hypothetical protein
MAFNLPSGWPTGSLLIDFASGAVAILVGFTGLCGGTAHYGAILFRLPKPDVERVTGIGFFVGLVAGVSVLLIEALS